MTDVTKKKRHRSPEHPYVDLGTAVEKAKVLKDKEHFADTPVNTAIGHWGYSPNSGTGMRVLAALLHFGLLDEDGTGDARVVRLSDLGKQVLGAPDPDVRASAIRKTALNPPIYADLLKKWGENGKLPSDASMKWQLEERGFNPNAVDGFIQDFRATVRFAKLLENGTLSETPEDTDGDDGGEPEEPRDLDTTQKKKVAMPSTQIAAKTDWDLTIPLIEGGQAILRVPIPVTEADFDLLKGVITTNLEAMKKAIVREPTTSDDGA